MLTQNNIAMNNRLHSLLIVILVSFTMQGHAQWTKTNFPTSMPNKMFFTSDGRLAVGEFSKMYSDSDDGGLYLSVDLGDTWEKVSMPNYNYAAFVETEEAFFAFGEGGTVIKTSDYKNWETITYGHVYEEGVELGDCYAAAYYKGRIYCAPLGMAPACSSDNGKTWTLTDGSGLDVYGGVWLYGMIVYQDQLYAYGGDGIFRLNEDLNSWTCVQQAFFAMHGVVHAQRLYIGFDVQGSPYPAMYSEDGTNWHELSISEDYTDQNSLGSMCSVGKTLFIGSMKGLFCSADGKSWENVSNGFPMENEAYTNPYVKPVCMLYHEGYVYASGFDMSTGQGGVFKLNVDKYAGLNHSSVQNVGVLMNDRCLFVQNAEDAVIRIYDLSGTEVLMCEGVRADLSDLAKGVYVYSVRTADESILTGKIVVQ